MAIYRELNLKVANSPGSLLGVCAALAAERVNLLALSLEASGILRLVVDNPLHAASHLRDLHYQVEERDVLYATVPNEPGALSRAVRLIADTGVNLEYAYVSGIETEPMVGVVLGVADAQRVSAVVGI